jgi:hypothetical protein
MSCIVPRTCTEVREAETEQGREASPLPLAAFREVSAYVLLGDPGSGKSTSFAAESTAHGGKAYFESARDFLTLDRDAERRGKTLFIDGLDEVRAGSGDARTPLDELRRRIDALGQPRFRLSCREADWLGTNDRESLAKVSPDADLSVLRLDPLSDENIAQILDARSVLDARSFIETARGRGVGGFLKNPQCLEMLADVVMGSGGWPESRLELFELACLQMVREHNTEHVAATERSSSSTVMPAEDVLRAAGRLCAVLLISGSSGCAFGPGREDAGYPESSRCAGEYREAARRAISTKLFKAAADGRYEPVHRHVAEFLAGRYLARLIAGERRNGRGGRHGIPPRRVFALMTGHDGEIVTALRGLSAWIAACSRDARTGLIERDAIGVTLYGDASRFSSAEKVELLKSLAAESDKLEEHLREAALNPTRSISAAGTLVAPETEQALRGILLDPCREDGQQKFVLFVLHALQHGAALPGLTEVLFQVVRDADRWPGVQRRALDALLHGGRGGEEFIASLKGLLKEVHAGDISDPDDHLLGTLLTKLYPGHLSPSDVWLHLTDSASDSFSWHYSFWVSHLVNNCPEVELADHLDVLVARQQELRSALESRRLQDVPGALLARGLKVYGDDIEIQRGYDWLGLALRANPGGDAIARVRTWLTQHPDTQKAILLEGLERASRLDDEGFRQRRGESEQRRYGADLPSDFGSWCMEQAVEWVDRDRRGAEYFLQRARNSAHGSAGVHGPSLEVLERRAREHVVLNAIWKAISDGEAKYRQEMERLERAHRCYGDAEERRHQEWLDWVRSNATALRENRCEPALLHQLATAYFGCLVGAEGPDPRARLKRILRNDGDLEDAALCGLRGAIRRDDLPDTTEIVRLRAENQEHLLGWPVLASLLEIYGADSGKLNELSRHQLQTALAFHFCTRGVVEPPWYRWVIRSCPRVVSDVLVRVARRPLQRGDESVDGVRGLAHRVDHAEVARYAALPLLRASAVRGKAGNRDLHELLWAALRYSEREPLLALIEQKLSRTSMNVAQRVSWLAAGLVVAPEDYIEPLESCVGSDESRAERVSKFFDTGAAPPLGVEKHESHRASVASLWAERLGVDVVYRLVRLMGRAGSSHASFSYQVQALAALPNEEAGVVLQALVSDPALSRWQKELIRALDDQLVVRRDATYRHPDVEQVRRTLDGGPPANPADLAALVTDRLVELGERIRNGNTDDWRQYWNEDPRGRPCKPKHEESCRDALLSDLQQRLPDEVDAQPEGHYADDKRADIRISCRDIQIPVEIKKNGHPRLWSALRDQLIAQYTRDPATDGYGIYLVLWFGEVDGHRTPPPPSGVRPKGPDELRGRLEGTLTPEEARKISVCVVDVSAPVREAEYRRSAAASATADPARG